MKEHQLSDFTRGWFIGDFSPSLLPTENFEVAVQQFKAGDKEARHIHKVATEFTVVVAGKAKMNDQILDAGTVIEISPGESASFEALEDTITTVVKVPCVAGDKFIVE